MPLFEYKCEKCNKVFEELVKNYNDQVKCSSCGGDAVRVYSGKMFTSTGKSCGGCTGNCKTCSGCK